MSVSIFNMDLVGKLSTEAKKIAMAKFRKMVEFWKDRNPLGEKTGNGDLDDLHDRWNIAFEALERQIVGNEEADDRLFDSLFGDERTTGAIEAWENDFLKNDLKDIIENGISQYEHSARQNVQQPKGDLEIKKWNMGAALFEMKRDFKGIIDFAESYDTEQAKMQNCLKGSNQLSSLARKISWDPAERMEEIAKKKTQEAPFLSDLDIIAITQMEDYEEFEKKCTEWKNRSETLSEAYRSRLKELGFELKDVAPEKLIETDVEKKKELFRSIEEKLQRSDELKRVSNAEKEIKQAEVELEKERPGYDTAKTDFEKAEGDLKQLKEKLRNSNDFKQKQAALQKEIEEIDSQKSREEMKERYQKDSEEKIQNKIKEFEDTVRERDDNKKRKDKPEEFARDLREKKFKAEEDKLGKELAEKTKQYTYSLEGSFKESNIMNFAQLEQAIEQREQEKEINAQNKLDKEKGLWQPKFSEAALALGAKEKAAFEKITSTLAEEIPALEKDMAALEETITKNKRLKEETEPKLNQNKETLKNLNSQMSTTEEHMKEANRSRDEEINRLLEERRNEDAKLANTNKKGKEAVEYFRKKGQIDLLLKTREDYRTHSPALIAAKLAEEAAKEIGMDPEVKGFDWRNLTMVDYTDLKKRESLKRQYCEGSQDKEAMARKFERQAELNKKRLELFIARVNEAYARYTPIDKMALDERFKSGNKLSDSEKYAPIKYTKTTENEIKSFEEQSWDKSVTELTNHIENCKKNALTLMHGARYYELTERNKEKPLDRNGKKELEYWNKNFEETEAVAKTVLATMEKGNDFWTSYCMLKEKKTELSGIVSELEEQFEEGNDGLNEALAEKEQKEKTLTEKKRQQQEITALHESWEKGLSNNDVHVVEEAGKVLVGYQTDETFRAAYDNLKELRQKEPVKVIPPDSEELKELKALKADYENDLKKAREEVNSLGDKVLLEEYDKAIKQEIEKKKEELDKEQDKYLKEDIEKEVSDYIAVMKHSKEKELKNLEEENEDIVSAKDHLSECEEKYKEAKEAFEEKNNKLKGWQDELAKAREKADKDLLNQYDNLPKLKTLCEKDAQLRDKCTRVADEAKRFSDIRQKIEEMKTAYDAVKGYRDQANSAQSDLLEKALQAESAKLLNGVKLFLNTADVGRADKSKENSDEYKDMNNALKGFQRMAENNELKKPETIAEQLRNMKEKAQTYIGKKQDQFAHKYLGYYSDQAKVRLDYAQRLIDFCDNGINKIEQVKTQAAAMAEPFAESLSKTGNLNLGGTYNTVGDFFRGYVRETVKNRSDIDNLTMENEWKVRAEIMEQKHGGKVDLNNAIEERKTKFAGKYAFETLSVQEEKDVTQWTQDYVDLDKQRKYLEVQVGIREKYVAPKVVNENKVKEQKSVEDDLDMLPGNPIISPFVM